MKFDIPITCMECTKFLGWSSIHTNALCGNCSIHNARMERLPKVIAKQKQAHSGINRTEKQ